LGMRSLQNRAGRFAAAIAFSVLCVSPAVLAAQTNYTVTPANDQGFGPMDTSAPAMPVQQIIDKFAAKESEARRALDNYTYTRNVRVETLDEDGKPDGRYEEVTDISYAPDGHKLEHVTFAPANSLTRIQMSPADFSDIEHRLPFVLTAEDIPSYKVTYVGRQKVDELNTYVFDVGPKTLEKGRRYLQGRIWVDQQDLQIVLVNGKNVPDDLRKGHEDLSPPFTTYREQVDGKYWFPTYTKSDATLHFPGGRGYMAQDVRIRYVVKYTDYKSFRSSIRITFEGQDISAAPGTNGDGKTPPASPPASTPTTPPHP
jgi:hypothetical protein